jgi:uncharacterized repeat protein (TIGR03803 family)
MWLHSLLTSWKSGLSRSPRPRSTRRCLTLEPLESRLTPSLSTLASFVPPTGAYPEAGVIMDSSGNLYGTTRTGGSSNDGTIFELAHGSGTISVLASFNGSNGANPYAGLIMDSSGNLFGATFYGGSSGDGTIVELAHGSHTITALASFNGSDGAHPVGSPIMDSSGNLYGTTAVGGSSGNGTVFELAHGSQTITSLASFNGTDGSSPDAGLTMDSSGNLYGTTYSGGASGFGTIFELAHGSQTITSLASFNGTEGVNPEAGLILDSSGNLYGTTPFGAGDDGTIFELAHGSHTITTLASFSGNNGNSPEAGLILDSSGDLYGTTVFGGSSNDGTIFELAHGSSTITTLASFSGSNGEGPQAGLITDSSGNLYGTTAVGGSSNDGTILELAHGSGAITTLASFNVSSAESPQAGLIMDSSGNRYGTTVFGGSSNDGTIFELAHGSQTITTLASFNGTDGANPEAGLIIDSSGDLYGTTSSGGASKDGTIFELVHGSGTISLLDSFNGTDGADPEASLVIDSTSNLYGTTSSGGASGDGTIFEVAHHSRTLTTLASFDGTDGEGPYAGLIVDSSGNLYGTTYGGGAAMDGTVFELAHGSGTITTLASFNGTDGDEPKAALIQDSSGNLYGTAIAGGSSGDGTVFELAHGSRTITTLASFNGTDGDGPKAALVLDSSGNLYGTTSGGGSSKDGTIFELAHGSGTMSVLASFNGSNGSNPEAGLIMDSSGNLYGTTYNGGSFNVGTIFELTGAATAAVQGIAASFVVSTGQPIGAAGILTGAERTDGRFEPVEVAAQDMAGNKAAILTTEQVKSPAGGEELVPALGDIDLFSLRDRGTEWWWTGHGNRGIRIRW